MVHDHGAWIASHVVDDNDGFRRDAVDGLRPFADIRNGPSFIILPDRKRLALDGLPQIAASKELTANLRF
jgi:hypothetical protein